MNKKIKCDKDWPLSVKSGQWLTTKGAALAKTGSAEYWLERHFRERFDLPEDAVDWLLSLWQVIQVFDDIADKDPVDRDELDRTIYTTLVGMPSNQFFFENSAILLPLLSVMVLKWKASDTVELAGNACATSFVWRAGYYDLVLAVVQIVHGTEAAMDIGQHVLKLYGETLEDYMKEMHDA